MARPAIERLRSMLDERGVEYRKDGCEFFYAEGHHPIHVWAINDESLCASIVGLTPEQAIAATLGDDEVARLRSCMAADAETHEELLAECGKLRELVRGLRYCAKEAYGMCARVPVGGEKPFTCCPLYDFDGNEHRCKKLMEELGVEI